MGGKHSPKESKRLKLDLEACNLSRGEEAIYNSAKREIALKFTMYTFCDGHILQSATV